MEKPVIMYLLSLLRCAGSEAAFGYMTMVLNLLAVLLACAGAWCDFRTRKIPNKLTVPIILCFWIFGFIRCGGYGVLNHLAGLGIGACTIVFWILGMLKAGDIKLYMAIGAMGGLTFGVNTVIASILAGGVFSAVYMIGSDTGRQRLRRLWDWFLLLLMTGRYAPYQPMDEDSYFCYGGCIAFGAVYAFFRIQGK